VYPRLRQPAAVTGELRRREPAVRVADDGVRRDAGFDRDNHDEARHDAADPAWIAEGRWLLLFAARRLDAAERAAKFLDLALVGELLALGDFDEFQHFVEMINHLLERLGNLRGVLDGPG